MSGPPKDVPAAELWLKLSERPRPTTEIDFPARNEDGTPIGRCKLWVLRESENHVARAQADIAAKEIMASGSPKNSEFSYGYEDIYRNELAVQLVAMACRNVDNPIFPLFPSAKLARQRCTTDELGILAQAYQHFRVHSGPLLSEMTGAEMEAWFTRLQEGGADVGPLVSWDSVTLRQFIKFLVLRAETSSTDTGSVGSLLADSLPEHASPVDDIVDADERAKPETP